MSVNKDQFNISNLNELEEGEITEPIINNPDILKLIVYIKLIFPFFPF